LNKSLHKSNTGTVLSALVPVLSFFRDVTNGVTDVTAGFFSFSPSSVTLKEKKIERMK